jgi:hypothetical protein
MASRPLLPPDDRTMVHANVIVEVGTVGRDARGPWERFAGCYLGGDGVERREEPRAALQVEVCLLPPRRSP